MGNGEPGELPIEIPKRIHFIGVCGTGMGALALLFREMGARVSGSDTQAYPPMGDLLEGAGIRVRLGYGPENLDRDVSYVVVGNAVSKDNPEAGEVLRRGLPYGSFPETLARFFLVSRQPIVVIGTHGKTTTTALLAWLLEVAGYDPGFLVGGEPRNFPSSSRSGRGSYFVVEGDEYDSSFFDKGPKFLHYRPRFSVFTSLEYDHSDIYPDVDSLRIQFQRFVRQIPPEGLLLVCSEYPSAVEIARGAPCRVETYGYRQDSDWRGTVTENGVDGLTMEVSCGGDLVGAFPSFLSGVHNGLNVLACVALLSRLGVPADQLRRGLAGFLGVRRRQEILGEADGILLVDDFAHHPTAVKETIQAMARRFPERRVLAVYEPRTHTSRKRVFQREYVEAFEHADVAVCARIFRAETVPEEERFRPDLWEMEMRQRGREAYYVREMNGLESFLVQNCRSGDLVLFMSSGDFDGVPARVLKALEGREGSKQKKTCPLTR